MQKGTGRSDGTGKVDGVEGGNGRKTARIEGEFEERHGYLVQWKLPKTQEGR